MPVMGGGGGLTPSCPAPPLHPPLLKSPQGPPPLGRGQAETHRRYPQRPLAPALYESETRQDKRQEASRAVQRGEGRGADEWGRQGCREPRTRGEAQ